ncbi:MAG: winged helix-turn-helix domain-containing protein, partial [Clostridia bacterium]|nr:winged helix-turn-helix domain-containing protein [Clostridia bacterium]
LEYLMSNKNIVLSRQIILSRVWGYDFEGDDRVVDTHIKIIRKALGENSKAIKTVVNVGYKFEEAEVNEQK